MMLYRKTLLAVLLTVSTSLLAENVKTVKSGPYRAAVLELYTSEGCSSCPPADKWLNELAMSTGSDLNVLPLAFHVDYWDYIGWKDEFADPAYTARQRQLGRLNRQRSIYTPEFFVDGREARGTSTVLKKIREANQTRSPIDLELSVHLQAGGYQLQLASKRLSDSEMKVQFVVFENGLSSEVVRGENAGRTLTHQQVVRYLSPAIDLKSNISHRIDIPERWKRHKLGLGALVKTYNDEYVQAVFTSMLPL